MPPDEMCLHCERNPCLTGHGLCAACAAVKGIRLLYLRRRGWTPRWERRLRRLTERAQKGLPLFADDLTPANPPSGE